MAKSDGGRNRTSMAALQNEPLPRVTIVVPAYNEAPRILHCVRALQAQSYPRDLLEIIIVDNGSTDETFELLQREAGIVVLQERAPGSYAARNRALEVASGDIVGFTDADCRPHGNWVENAVEYLKSPAVGVVAGHVELDFDHLERPNSSELFEKCFAFKQAQNARDGVCVTANWFSPRRLLQLMGGFDGTLKSGGDHKLSQRICSAGYQIVYAADVVVRHPARTRFGDLTRKRRRVIGGAFVTQRRSRRKPFPILLAFLVKETALRLGALARDVPLRPVERLRVGGLLIVLCGISVLEATRLQLGGEPLRQ